MLPSGQQAVFLNRIGWARTYLKQACLIEATRRGYFRISQRGLDVLKKNPEKIAVKFLEQFEEFRDFRKRKKKVTGNGGDNNDKETGKTPAEELETAYENLRENLAKELIEKFKECPPSLFEKIIVELLVKMGYGGAGKMQVRQSARVVMSLGSQ